jgi:hypothetical protein
MTPEQLVPTLETCKLLKEAGFKQETYFRYVYASFPKKWFLYTPDSRSSKEIAIPAPTLQELLEELPRFYHEYCKGISLEWMELLNKETHLWEYNWWVGYDDIDTLLHNSIAASHPSNPAEAAALLWLELRKENKQ